MKRLFIFLLLLLAPLALIRGGDGTEQKLDDRPSESSEEELKKKFLEEKEAIKQQEHFERSMPERQERLEQEYLDKLVFLEKKKQLRRKKF